MGERCVDIPVPETIPETQANRQIEHHVDISASFTAGRNDRRPKLDALASTLIEGEADPAAQSARLRGYFCVIASLVGGNDRQGATLRRNRVPLAHQCDHSGIDRSVS